MSEAPKRIWAWPNHDARGWYAGGCSNEINLGLDRPSDEEQRLYVRADLCFQQPDARLAALEAENARLREALEPMREWAKQHCAEAPEWDDDCTVRPVAWISELRRAVAALSREAE